MWACSLFSNPGGWAIIGQTSSLLHYLPLLATSVLLVSLIWSAATRDRKTNSMKLTAPSMSMEKNSQTMKHVSELTRSRSREAGNAYSSIPLFVAALVVITMAVVVRHIPRRPVVLMCPENCLGVVSTDGPNQFTFRNIRTGEVSRLHFDPKESVPFYPGFVLSKLSFYPNRLYDELPSDTMAYIIVRGSDTQWDAILAPVVKDDGPTRPVLARNCWNTADDSDTVCEGGKAMFVAESY